MMASGIVAVSALEARAMARAYPGAGLSEMAAARATGVTPECPGARGGVFPGVAWGEFAGMRAVGVDAAFVRSLQRHRGDSVEPDEAIEARAMGMSRGVAAEVRRATAAARSGAAAAARASHEVRAAIAAEPPEPPEPPEPANED